MTHATWVTHGHGYVLPRKISWTPQVSAERLRNFQTRGQKILPGGASLFQVPMDEAPGRGRRIASPSTGARGVPVMAALGM